MTKAEIQEQALTLPVEERLELVEALWDSIERDADDLPVHEWQKELLDRRLAEAQGDFDG